MKRKILGIMGLVIILNAVGYLVYRENITQSIVGDYYYQRLQNIDLGSCITGSNDFQAIRICVNKFGSPIFILGDTINGNFRIYISKPYAENYVETKNWKWNGSGAGVRDSFHPNRCFIVQEVDVPTFTEEQKALIRNSIGKWYQANPEAERRYIIGVKKKNGNLVIESLPLEVFKNYTEYCPDYVGMNYLDDRPNLNLDETIVEISRK
jgi:hypothetical protein